MTQFKRKGLNIFTGRFQSFQFKCAKPARVLFLDSLTFSYPPFTDFIPSFTYSLFSGFVTGNTFASSFKTKTMEIINDPRKPEFDRYQKRQRQGKMTAGWILIIIGIALALKKSGMDFPDWLFSWKTLLIVIGLFVGFKNSFRGIGWLVPILIGSIFLLSDFYPLAPFRTFIAPAVLIILGLFMIFRRRNSNCGPHRHHDWRNRWNEPTSSNPEATSHEDRLEVNAIFAGVKKNIISKEFRGGEINSIFGGSEINLMQADFTGTVTIDATQVLGGTKLIIPAHWSVQSELTAILGGVEDRRPVTTTSVDSTKVLRLTGTCVLGGLEILSY